MKCYLLAGTLPLHSAVVTDTRCEQDGAHQCSYIEGRDDHGEPFHEELLAVNGYRGEECHFLQQCTC